MTDDLSAMAVVAAVAEARRQLVPVPEERCEPFSGYFLCLGAGSAARA